MQTWEYVQFEFRQGTGYTRRVTFPDGTTWDKIAESDVMKVLSRLGAEGWELIGTPEAGFGVFYFKRPLLPGSRAS